eukprot:TRINITY_DN2168_c0_g1_i2.p1 TRINITY_DN2168_c0_g1~~TRINITY_DN2168_c0_g1_i2.p1  ORF type:complete len:300 (-),score=46.05 TRINITY_DN2168_c0_g1_i2:287-1150(-)
MKTYKLISRKQMALLLNKRRRSKQGENYIKKSQVENNKIDDKKSINNTENSINKLQVEQNGNNRADTFEKLSTQKQLKQSKIQEKSSPGVVYLSRIPPKLKPGKVRNLLSNFGNIGRVYLAPEDGWITKRRRRQGAGVGKQFVEGWVEFLDKRDARKAAEMLNNQPMRGRRRSSHWDDLWNIKYLKNFKWDHLTEEIAYIMSVKDQKVQQEIAKAKQEREFYFKQSGLAKHIEAMQRNKEINNDAEEYAYAQNNEVVVQENELGEQEDSDFELGYDLMGLIGGRQLT